MAPSALSVLFCGDEDVEALLSVLGADLRTDDLDAGQKAAFYLRAHSWATDRIKFYTSGLYDAAALQSSWLVNEWATALSTYYLCLRRGNPSASGIASLVFGQEGTDDRGVMGDLEDVRKGLAQVPDVGQRNGGGIAWSNVTVDPRYRVRQLRVQRDRSERTVPRGYSQDVDYASENYYEF